VKTNERMLYDFLFDNLYPSLRENLRTLVLWEMTVPVDLEELRQNNSFKEDLSITIFLYDLSLHAFWRSSESIGLLIEEIEKELGLQPGEST
jgi:hypothetical protein